jgi:hypothetical protein
VPGFFGPLVAATLVVQITIAVVGSSLSALDTRGADLEPGFGGTAQIGELFLTRFLFAFEAAGILILMAVVAGVVLARRRRGLEEPTDLPSVLATGADGDDLGPRPEAEREEAGRIPAGTAEGRGDPTVERGG